MRRIFAMILLVGVLALGAENAHVDHLKHIEKLIANLQHAVKHGVKQGDQATKELNERLASLSKEVSGAIKQGERNRNRSDAEVRQTVHKDIRSLANFIQSLSDHVFDQLHKTTDELQKQAEQIDE